MNQKSYRAILFTVIIFASCRKENNSTSNNTTPTPQPAACFSISGYTSKDELNQYTGVVDSTDWRIDNYWSTCEQQLFGGTNFNTNCTFDDTLLTNPSGYPNPTTDVFHMDIGIHFISSDTNFIHAINHHDSTITMDLLFFNQNLQQVGSVHTNKHSIRSLSFSLDQMDNHPYDTLFRVYYKLTDPNNCVRMGHGDIIRR